MTVFFQFIALNLFNLIVLISSSKILFSFSYIESVLSKLSLFRKTDFDCFYLKSSMNDMNMIINQHRSDPADIGAASGQIANPLGRIFIALQHLQ